MPQYLSTVNFIFYVMDRSILFSGYLQVRFKHTIKLHKLSVSGHRIFGQVYYDFGSEKLFYSPFLNLKLVSGLGVSVRGEGEWPWVGLEPHHVHGSIEPPHWAGTPLA